MKGAAGMVDRVKSPAAQLGETADRLTKCLAEGFCKRCDQAVTAFAVEYPLDHPEHYDGTSEFQCGRCGRREGRWTGRVLTGGATEPRHGREREETIPEEQSRFMVGSQPR